MSRGEFLSGKSAVGGTDALADNSCNDKQLLTLIKYLTEEATGEKIFENQILINTPIVRNGKQATIGFAPEDW